MLAQKPIHEMDIFRAFIIGADGHKTIPEDWVSPTALRPLLLNDPALVWLQYHGAQHGFKKDAEQYSLLGWLGEQGGRFESGWIQRVAPEAVQANDADMDVRRLGVKSFMKTLECMGKGAPVITKAALWHAPSRTYGTADIIAKTSWLRKNFASLRDLLDGEPDHYVILDTKMKTNLDSPAKATDLAVDSNQVRMYSSILGSLQNSMPRYAFLVTKDRVLDPLPVKVGYKLGDPLEDDIESMLELHRRIKRGGSDLRPWVDELVAANPFNTKDAPWSNAKKIIVAERMPKRSLHFIPYIGAFEAEMLRAVGMLSVDDLFAAGPQALRNANIPGFGQKKLARAEAILVANRAEHLGEVIVPNSVVPRRRKVELFVDMEFYGTGMKTDFENWPEMKGSEMVFMIGVGYENAKGKWEFKRFVAHEDSLDSERFMWKQFVSYLRSQGVIYGSAQEATAVLSTEASLYHWSAAEVHQAKRAAERVGISVLANLPWADLQKPFHNGPIALPKQWNFSIKSVSKALGEFSPEHRTDYPEKLGVGSDAMVMALRAYEHGGDVVNSDEIKLVTKYLEVDCKCLWQILRWLRTASGQNDDTSRMYGIRQGGMPSIRWYQHSKERMQSTATICSVGYAPSGRTFS